MSPSRGTDSDISIDVRFGSLREWGATVSTEFVDPLEPEDEDDTKAEKFDWFSHWYPVMLVCDLDKRVPHAKKVMGLDVVVWWDRNEKTWKVFDDACPHRYDVLIENLMDPTHVPYAHYGLMQTRKPKAIMFQLGVGCYKSSAEKRAALIFICVPVSPATTD